MASISNTKPALVVLQNTWDGCTSCGCSRFRPNPKVFVCDGASAEILVVMDSPDDYYDPDSNSLLLELLDRAGLRTKSIAYTSALGCTPFAETPETENNKRQIVKRQASQEELNACSSRLLEVVYEIDPKIILTFGEAAFHAIERGRIRKMSEIQGKLYTVSLPARSPALKKAGILYGVIPLVSPSYIMKNPSIADHGPMMTTLGILREVKETLRWLDEHKS